MPEAVRIRSALSTPFCMLTTMPCGERKGGQLARRRFRVCRLHAEEQDFGAARRAHFGRGFGADHLLEFECIEEESVALHGIGKRLPANHRDGRARAREHSAKIPAEAPAPTTAIRGHSGWVVMG